MFLILEPIKTNLRYLSMTNNPLPHPQFFSSMARIVIDTEGRVVKLAAPRAALPGNVLSFVLCPFLPALYHARFRACR
jgi:hypothetical protein